MQISAIVTGGALDFFVRKKQQKKFFIRFSANIEKDLS
jgi:hypothetical protein